MSNPSPLPKKKINIWYLLQFLKGYTGLIIWTAVFLVAGRIASTLDPVWLKKIIDGVGKGSSLTVLMPVVFAYFGFKFLAAFFDYLRDLIFSPAEMGIARTLSDHLFKHLLALPTSYHVEQKLGGMARKITRGGRAITFILDFLVINILPTIIELIVVTVFLLRLYAPIYAITTFATVVVYTWFTLWATEKRQKYRVAANTADDEVSSLEVDSLANIETVKYFNNEGRMHDKYLPAINARYDLSVASNKLFALISGIQSVIILVGLGIILFVAIKQTLGGLLTIGDLVLLTTYIVRLSGPIGVLGFIYRQIKDGFTDLEGMAKMLQEEITVPEPKNPQPIAVPAGEVVFDDVSFQYSSSRVVLGNISIRVAPGQKIAFVGPSGVGKSTIVKLIFRLFDPTHGKILIDGVDLRDMDKEDRRSMFAIVPQEPALFNTTIAENIRFGKTDATQEEIEAAAKLASIDSYIQSLPLKYETMVGERGVKLSGGEKQRVAIARAIIRQPKVLVFDEATSSLDSRSEKDIQIALDTISEGRTTIAVAHRLSTIAGSDQIYVLNKGGVAEQGTHKELLARNGLYSQLWKLQVSQKYHQEHDNDVVAA